MKKIASLFLILVSTFCAHSNWIDLNTGINDNLTGTVFWGNNGAVSGNKGLYYTINGGNGPANWTRYNIIGNQSDSIIYNNTQFTHCYSANYNYVFACGQDTVNNEAVVFQFSFATLTHTLLYVGNSNTKLNNIGYSGIGNHYLAVGENQLIVEFDLNVNGNLINYGGAINYLAIANTYSRFTIVAHNYKIEGVDNNPGLTLTTYNTAGHEFEDVEKTLDNYALATGNGIFSLNSLNDGVTSLSSVLAPAINANAILSANNYIFLGTNQGIYRKSNSNNHEWQPSSLQHTINDFWFDTGQSIHYAIGDSGVILWTSDNGGTPVPSIRLSGFGKCIGESPYIYHNEGSGTSCEWYVNGILTSNYCWSIGYNFSAIGAYTVKLKVLNAVGVDSAQIIINVVDPPLVGLNYTIDDTILCHEETVDIQLDTSQFFVNYEIYNINTGVSYGLSPDGNGDTINFTSALINKTGVFQIRSNSTIAQCSSDFTDSTNIIVEQTRANFHAGTLNAIPGESINFYENCLDATNYLWNFSPDASILSSNNSEVSNSFTNIGNPLIELICWSNDFCYDTIQKLGPTIYPSPNSIDSCWVNLSSGPAPLWMGYYYPHIHNMTETSNGYLVSGTHYDESFATRNGDSLYLDWYGAYLNQYDYNGVLKWSINAVGAGSGVIGAGNDYKKFSIKSTAIDSHGNIYACGYFSDYFVDNRGDTINVPAGKGVILKLDSLGKTIWHRSCNLMNPLEVSVDNLDNVLISYMCDYTTKLLYLNEFPTNTIVGQNPSNNYGIMKLDENGVFLWDVPLQIDFINMGDIVELQFDSNNNIYVASIIELSTTIYAVNNAGGTVIPAAGNNGGKTLIFKLNSNGELQWTLRSRTLGAAVDFTIPYDMESDDLGNLYISGKNKCHIDTNIITHIFENTDGSITSSNVGEYYIAKINSNGICQWIRGANNSYYGYGEQIDLLNDTLYVVGKLSELNQIQTTVELRNPNGTFIPLTLSATDYFIGVYDTSGNVMKTIKNADNVNIPFYAFQNTSGFFKKNNGSYYISRNGEIANYTDFGDTIVQTNGREGWVTKAEEGCGIITNLVYAYEVDTALCLGSDYTFSDGAVLNNIQNNITDTIFYTSSLGFDSLDITNITTLPTYLTFDTIHVCNNSVNTFPNGSVIANTVSDTTQLSNFQSIFGCDSIISTTLLMVPDIFTFDTLKVCNNSVNTFPDGSVIANTVSDTTQLSNFQSIFGCDSTVSTTLLVEEIVPFTFDTVNVCYNALHVFPDGSFITNAIDDTTNISVLQTGLGCDSLIYTTCNVVANYMDYDTIYLCTYNSYTFMDGTLSDDVTDTINHVSQFQTINGCDSLFSEILIPTIIDTSISLQNYTLTANQVQGAGITYQWVDCDNNFNGIPNETLQSFSPTVDGNYAVQISSDLCTYMSDCFLIDFMGLGIDGTKFSYYPNPVIDILNIEFITTTDNVITVYDMNGKVVITEIEVGSQIQINTSDLAPAMYHVSVVGNNLTHYFYFIKL